MKKFLVFSCGRSGSFLLHRSLQLYLFHNNLATRTSCKIGVTPTELFNQNVNECPWLVDTKENLIQVRHSPGTRKIPNEVYISNETDLHQYEEYKNAKLLKNNYNVSEILEKYKHQHYFLKILSHHNINDNDFNYLKQNYNWIILKRPLEEIVASYLISWNSNNPTHLLMNLNYELPKQFIADKNTVLKIIQRYKNFVEIKNKITSFKEINYSEIANLLPHEIAHKVFDKSNFYHEQFVRKNPYNFNDVKNIIINWNEVLEWINE